MTPTEQIAFQPALADAGVEDRRFPARVGADDHDRIGFVDAGDGRIEEIAGAAEFRVELGAVLPAIERSGCRGSRSEASARTFPRPRKDRRRSRRFSAARVAFDLRGDGGESFAPGRRPQLAAFAQIGLVETPRLQAIDDLPRLVRDPFLVHRVIDARQDAHDLAAARVDADRGAQRIHDVDRIRSWRVPRSAP